MPPFTTLVGPSAVAESRYADSERTVGFYLQKNDGPGAASPWSLLPFPGLTSRAVAAEGPGRGLWAMDGRCLRVAGYRVYEVASNWIQTLKGDVARDANPAQLVSSGDAGGQVAISTGGSLYIFNLITGLLSIAIAGVVANQVGYLDGYFLALAQATSTLRISNLLDGLTWDPTQFLQRSTAPDRWQALLVSGPYIYLFGSETSDVLYDAGAFPFPFAIVSGALLLVGIAAPFSAANVAGVPVWLAKTSGGGLSVVRGNGTGQPSRISSHALEKALRGFATVTDAEGSAFEFSGHAFYKLTFPTAGATWVYDVTSDQWTEWPTWNSQSGAEEAHRALHHCSAFGSHVVDDRATGDLYTLDDGVYTDNGAVIRRLRRAPLPILSGGQGMWTYLNALEAFMDVGVGVQNDPGSTPLVALKLSRDGGNTWGSERTCSAGAAGKYEARVRWRNLGRYRDGKGVAELVMTDPVRYAMHGGVLDVQGGTA